jgi:hypothetical protein
LAIRAALGQLPFRAAPASSVFRSDVQRGTPAQGPDAIGGGFLLTIGKYRPNRNRITARRGVAPGDHGTCAGADAAWEDGCDARQSTAFQLFALATDKSLD